MSKDPVKALQWLDAQPPAPNRDMLTGIACGALLARDPVAALSRATAISNDELRLEAIGGLIQQWGRRDPDAASNWIRGSGLPEETKQRLGRQLPQ